ncbi:hypothetical protein [Streptomyces chryseus]
MLLHHSRGFAARRTGPRPHPSPPHDAPSGASRHVPLWPPVMHPVSAGGRALRAAVTTYRAGFGDDRAGKGGVPVPVVLA